MPHAASDCFVHSRQTPTHVESKQHVAGVPTELPAGRNALSDESPPTLRQELGVVMLTAVLFFYPNVAQTILSIFTCYPLEGRHWWAS